jgi:hypothetical protein
METPGFNVYQFESELNLPHKITAILTATRGRLSWVLESFVIFSGATDNNVHIFNIEVKEEGESVPDTEENLFEIIKGHAFEPILEYLKNMTSSTIDTGKLVKLDERSGIISLKRLWMDNHNVKYFQEITNKSKSNKLHDALNKITNLGRVSHPMKRFKNK